MLDEKKRVWHGSPEKQEVAFWAVYNIRFETVTPCIGN